MLPRVNLVRCDDADYLLFSKDDAITYYLYHNGGWETHLTAISRLFYDGLEAPFVLDIGANLGAYAIPVAKDLQKLNGTIFCYEPQRIVFYQLCGNIFLNRLDNAWAFCEAIGDTDGMISVPPVDYHTTNNNGSFSLSPQAREKADFLKIADAPVLAETPCRRLDSLQLPKAPCLIKIDVEGYELKVLYGGAKFLQASNFPPILFEVWQADWFQQEAQKLFEFLNILGYKIFAISGDDYLAQHPSHARQIFLRHDEGGQLTVGRIS